MKAHGNSATSENRTLIAGTAFLLASTITCVLIGLLPALNAAAFSWDFWNKALVHCPYEDNENWTRIGQNRYIRVDHREGKSIFYCSLGVCYTKEQSEEKGKIEKWGIGPAYWEGRAVVFLKQKKMKVLKSMYFSRTGQTIRKWEWPEYETVFDKRKVRHMGPYGMHFDTEEPFERTVRDLGEDIRPGSIGEDIYNYIKQMYGLN